MRIEEALDRVLIGDCLDSMKGLPDDSVDAIVTDPPYGLEFMGKNWDGGVPGKAFWQEAMRVAKPGAYLLAFGGSRTYHRLATAIEDAGWEVRDCIMWVYLSGFPKSADVSKLIDNHLGAVRETKTVPMGPTGNKYFFGEGDYRPWAEKAAKLGYNVTAGDTPASPEAAEWQGWGTALKPAYEPVIVARKPLIGTVAENILKHGTGAINIDESRVPAGGDKLRGGANSASFGYTEGWDRPWKHDEEAREVHKARSDANQAKAEELGRWPANLILGEGAGATLDEQSGITKSRAGKPRGTFKKGLFANSEFNKVGTEHNDEGGASRMFYCPKPTQKEREQGLEAMPDGNWNDGRKAVSDRPYLRQQTSRKNVHPTVKPVALMEYLIKLVTRKGGVVLDPFCGSGTTGMAARRLGYHYIMMELSPEYAEIASLRIGSIKVEKTVQQTLALENAPVKVKAQSALDKWF